MNEYGESELIFDNSLVQIDVCCSCSDRDEMFRVSAKLPKPERIDLFQISTLITPGLAYGLSAYSATDLLHSSLSEGHESI